MQEGLEESSWTMYFETEDGLGHYDDSSMISDAASPIVSVEEDTASSPSNRTKVSPRYTHYTLHIHRPKWQCAYYIPCVVY